MRHEKELLLCLLKERRKQEKKNQKKKKKIEKKKKKMKDDMNTFRAVEWFIVLFLYTLLNCCSCGYCNFIGQVGIRKRDYLIVTDYEIGNE